MAFSNLSSWEAFLKSSVFSERVDRVVCAGGKILEADAFVAPIHLHNFFCNLVIRNTRTLLAHMAKSGTRDNQMKEN